jgi:uncharacterized membrane protein
MNFAAIKLFTYGAIIILAVLGAYFLPQQRVVLLLVAVTVWIGTTCLSLWNIKKNENQK